jgi:GTP-binding protein YchF
MKLGIFGFPQVGKTTLFNLLTGSQQATGSGRRQDPNVGIARVPDQRLDYLDSIFKPKKRTPATFECVDIVGLNRSKGSSSMNLAVLKPVEALAHVVRAFEDELIPHEEGAIDPKRDIETMEMELILADMESVQKRVVKLKSEIAKAGRTEDKKELPLQEKVLAWLESEKPLREMELDPEEEKQLRGFAYLSAKPLLLVLNVGESAVGDLAVAIKNAGIDIESPRPRTYATAVSAQIEMEVSQLSTEEAASFQSDLGIKEPALDRTLQAAFKLLGLIRFYTAGDKECRAWPVRDGSTAVKASGTIHSDFEKGFIRAEVTAFEKFKEAGSFSVAKEKGWLRLEGKEYMVHDGDLMEFRFAL